MTKIVVGLEAAGLVAPPARTTTDRRIVRVKLTAEGRRALPAEPIAAHRLSGAPPARACPTTTGAALGDVVRLLEHLVEQP